jgi:hypothetical protein
MAGLAPSRIGDCAIKKETVRAFTHADTADRGTDRRIRIGLGWCSAWSADEGIVDIAPAPADEIGTGPFAASTVDIPGPAEIYPGLLGLPRTPRPRRRGPTDSCAPR